MPSRVIEVRSQADRNSVRLCNSADITPGPYIALSYCWGGPQTAATTSHNIDSYRASIALSSLPQTIQDAVIATRALGVSCLWVDSMCIIQDDVEDKAQEVNRMGDVYANSYLTISASRASKAAEGFLASRAHGIGVEGLGLPDSRGNPSTGGVQAVTNRRMDSSLDRVATLVLCLADGRQGHVNMLHRTGYLTALDPVAARAWTYQERLLAPRVLGYGRCLTWACSRDQELDTHTGDIWTMNPTDIPRLGTAVRRRDGPFTGGDLLGKWQFMIQAFSLCHMTLPSDKLPAAAGLAQYMSLLRPRDRYFAGLWKSSLAADMMWRASNGGVRPQKWRAPTWSWASLDGLILYNGEFGTAGDQDVLIADVDYQADYLSEASPFGELKSALLTLTGYIGQTYRLLVGRMWHGVNSREVFGDVSRIDKLPDEGRPRIEIDTEEDELVFPPLDSPIWSTIQAGKDTLLASSPVWCLAVYGRSACGLGRGCFDNVVDTVMDGLLLEKIEDGSYRRIGIFDMSEWDSGGDIAWGRPQEIRLR